MKEEIKIPDSGLAVYQTASSLLERNSVKWLDQLFNRPGIKANFTIEDKKPDVDGTFEILSNSRFDGRFEVQIKTYNAKSSKNKPKYSCDVKLLNYALKNRISCILLFVVDIINNRAYWKYLTESFIVDQNVKENQKKTTIKFTEEEYVNDEYFNKCLSTWHSYFLIKNNGIYFDVGSVEESEKKLKAVVKLFENINLSTLSKDEIIFIQKFIDRFNHLLDGDFNFIKRFYYPHMWKMGLAIGTFTPTSLTYVLYPILWGSNDFILKKIKLYNFSDLDRSFENNFLTAGINQSHNAIMSGSPDIIMDDINKKIKEIIERKKFLFLTTEIAIEHIFDAIKEHSRFWRIEQPDVIKLNELKEFLEKNHSSSINYQTTQFSSSSISNLSTIYQCTNYLLNNNIQEINRIHPILPKESEISYPEYLYRKLKNIYSLIPPTFDAYMYYAFPSLQSKVTFWDSYDLISVNFLSNGNKFYIIMHYFKRSDGISVQPQLLFTKDFSHDLYKNYIHTGFYNQDYFKTNYTLNGICYKLYLVHGDDIHRIENKYSIFYLLYSFLARRFNNYFGPNNQISSLSNI